MNAPLPPRRRLRALWWVLGTCTAIIVVAVLLAAIWLSNALDPPEETPMQPQQTAALKDELRAKGSAEDALARYEQQIARTADQIAQLVPGLSWQWNSTSTTITCGGELKDTGGVQVLTRHAYFDGPIPDSAWDSALNLVRDTGSTFGATNMSVFTDRPGEHDIELIGENGAQVRFGTRIRSTLSARSDCHLRGDDLQIPS
jgi:Lipoprotein confined to pathogenic Mycobacterium